jgi:hypothetical protein
VTVPAPDAPDAPDADERTPITSNLGATRALAREVAAAHYCAAAITQHARQLVRLGQATLGALVVIAALLGGVLAALLVLLAR